MDGFVVLGIFAQFLLTTSPHICLPPPLYDQVRRMALDCLHHWVEEYCVDGFVVLNAEHLTQDQFGGILDNPPLPEEIATDPILR